MIECYDYNDDVHLRCALAVVILAAGMFAQSAPSSCPADRPVDDIIAEIEKQQPKRPRNKNPLPTRICVFGWCRETRRTPPAVPQPAPSTEAPPSTGDISTSKTPVDKCNDAMERALEAAHNVEVGDFYYFEKLDFEAALLRYRDAATQKPGDAIHVRMGRTFEKRNQLPQAIEQYELALKLAGPEKWSAEATAALQRLQPSHR